MDENGKIRCVAIDDEPLALEVIDKFCQRMGGTELHTFSDPSRAMQMIADQRPDIVFLDIEMENVSGLDLASQMPDNTCVIFTTAFPDYALKGFELDAVDYLHKPFAYDRFKTAIAKAMRRIAIQRPPEDAEQYIQVKKEYNNVSIPLSKILYVEAMEGYVKIFLDSGECILSRMILKIIGNRLPARNFIRIHRSYIVQKSKIASFSRREVKLSNGKTIPVGRQYAGVLDSL